MLNTENIKMTWYHPKYYAELKRQARLQAQAHPHPQPSQVDYRHRLQANHEKTVHEPGPSEPGSGSQIPGTGNK